jgi:hypothetical protein
VRRDGDLIQFTLTLRRIVNKPAIELS